MAIFNATVEITLLIKDAKSESIKTMNDFHKGFIVKTYFLCYKIAKLLSNFIQSYCPHQYRDRKLEALLNSPLLCYRVAASSACSETHADISQYLRIIWMYQGSMRSLTCCGVCELEAIFLFDSHLLTFIPSIRILPQYTHLHQLFQFFFNYFVKDSLIGTLPKCYNYIEH